MECATTCNENTQEQNSQTDITTEVQVENQAKQTELECATTSTEDVPTINTNKKQYDIDHSIDRETHDLPELTKDITTDDLTTNESPLHVLQDTTTDQVTMQDNLPLLECRDDLEDFETLMNLVDDYDNTTLVPIDGPPQKDIVKEMNKDCGINNDLELAMENAKFLDRHLLVDSTNIPTESGKTKKNRTETAKNKKITIRTNTPGSPKGQLTVKTHGIRTLGPEE